MSSAFLKKSLELVDTETQVLRTQSDGDYSQLKFRNKKKKLKDLRGASDVKRKNIEAVEKIRKETKKINNKHNITFKAKLLHKPVNEKITNKILEYIHAPGLDKKEKEKETEKTAFTEEDFVKFEKEFFAN